MSVTKVEGPFLFRCVFQGRFNYFHVFPNFKVLSPLERNRVTEHIFLFSPGGNNFLLRPALKKFCLQDGISKGFGIDWIQMSHNISQRSFITIVYYIIDYLLWLFTIESEYFLGYFSSTEVPGKTKYVFQPMNWWPLTSLDSWEEIYLIE